MCQSSCVRSRVEAAFIEGASARVERSTTLAKVFSTGNQIRCTACLDCGAITRLRVDPKALAEQLP